MSTYIDPSMTDGLIRYHEALKDHESIIRMALGVYRERMEAAREEAQAAYEAGQADPVLKATQDASFMTNDGYCQAAAMFADSAKQAEEANMSILNAICPDEDEG